VSVVCVRKTPWGLCCDWYILQKNTQLKDLGIKETVENKRCNVITARRESSI